MDLDDISLVTSLWIVFAFTLGFVLLLLLLSAKRRKILRSGLGDEEILRNLRKRYRTFFYEKWTIARQNSGIPLFTLSNSPTLIAAKNEAGALDESQSLSKELEKDLGKITGWSKFGVGLCAFFIGSFAVLAVAGTFYRYSGQPLRIGGAEYRLVKQGNLFDSSKGPSLRENALARFERREFVDWREGDVIALLLPSETSISLRRIYEILPEGTISVKTDQEALPSAAETSLPQESYAGTFDGYQSYPLGLAFGFVRSNFGIATLLFMSLATYLYIYCFAGIDLLYQRREYFLSQGIDRENDRIYKEEVRRLNRTSD